MHPVTVSVRRPSALAVGAGVGLAVLLTGCGGGDDGTARADLVESLGFLRSDLGLTEAEVACTARTVEERLGDGADLAGLAEQVRRVADGDIALTDLPDDTSAVLTGSITTCAGSS